MPAPKVVTPQVRSDDTGRIEFDYPEEKEMCPCQQRALEEQSGLSQDKEETQVEIQRVYLGFKSKVFSL